MRDPENVVFFASPDMHDKFNKFWDMAKASKGQQSLEKIIITILKTIGSSTTKSSYKDPNNAIKTS